METAKKSATKTFWRFVPLGIVYSMMCLGLPSCDKAAEAELQELIAVTEKSGNTCGLGISANKTISEPVVVNFGDSLVLEFSYPSSYTDPDGNVFSCESKSYIKIKAPQDTLYADNYDGLVYIGEGKRVAESIVSGEVTLKKLQQTFIDGRDPYISEIAIDKGYEVVKHVNSAGETIEMPYLKVKAADLSSIDAQMNEPIATSIKPVYCARTTRAEGDEPHEKYNIKVTFDFEIVGVGTPDDTNQVLQIEVNFPGVIGSPPPPELVDIKYRKGYVWFEPHDNLPLRYYYVLFRERYYSNDEVLTDVFHDNGTYGFINGISTFAPFGNALYTGDTILSDGTHAVYHKMFSDENNNDYREVYYAKTGVPDIEKLDTLTFINEFKSPGDWATYQVFDTGYHYDPDDPHEAWYMHPVGPWRVLYLYYGRPGPRLRDTRVSIQLTDLFCYLDNQLFDFTEFWPVFNWDIRFENSKMPDGETPAKVLTHGCTVDFLGQEFYFATVDTVYQLP